MRWIGRIAVAVLLVAVVWAALGFFTIRNAVEDSHALINPATAAALDPAPGGLLSTPTNVLIVGKDARKGETRSRADTILIMRTDPRSGRIKYLSIPRDTRVNHPVRGPEKINASFFHGGQVGVIRAVKRHTGLSIHHIMVVNFRSFPRLVDELGGVTVNNPTNLENCSYPGGRTVSFPRGPVDLDGERALEFARVRQCDSDFQRALRQQALLSAMKKKVLSPTSLPLAPWRGAAVTRAVATDMGTTDLIKFGWLQARLDQNPEDRILLSGSGQFIDGQSFVVPDPDANEAEVARFIAS
jgi:LCP family protein required for cell wall assembly